MKVRYAELLPHEFRQRLADRPIAYLPLGTLEWHGEHMPLGSDALISEGLMVAAAQRLGGIVLPAIYLGPDKVLLTDSGIQLQGMDFVDPSSPGEPLVGSCYWVSEAFFISLIEEILGQLKRTGFQAVFADGHGPSREAWARNLHIWQQRFGLRLFGVWDEVREAWRSQLDHAGANETSLVMAIRPDLVDLSQLPPDRWVWPVAVEGEDPRDATEIAGRIAIEQSIQVLDQLFRQAGL
jgi:creatinine amidohydrolase